MDFASDLKRRSDAVEASIDRLLPAEGERPARLHSAMRYAMRAGGKRLRPVLVAGAADLFAGPERADPMPAAVAVECVHTYSLIHDDLPCMDDDDLRRGRPTVHRAYDEATALLAGDALLTFAFELLAAHYPPALAARLTGELAAAAGSRRLIGGQMEDLLAEKDAKVGADGVEFIHLNKTAAMIEASLVMGGVTGGADAGALEKLRRAGRHLGLAFQIQDDVLDATIETAELGKTAGKDAKAGKATYPRIHGLEASRRIAAEHTETCMRLLEDLAGRGGFLPELARSLGSRRK